MRKVLFLDFDGVLNSEQHYLTNSPQEELDKRAVAHLAKIIEATDCEIVISSTWRKFYSLEELRDILMDYGLPEQYGPKIIDKTPDLDKRISGSILHTSAKRGDEVRLWLEENNFDGNYVAVDDDEDFDPDQNLVLCDYKDGLDAETARICIEILNRKASSAFNPPNT